MTNFLMIIRPDMLSKAGSRFKGLILLASKGPWFFPPNKHDNGQQDNHRNNQKGCNENHGYSRAWLFDQFLFLLHLLQFWGGGVVLHFGFNNCLGFFRERRVHSMQLIQRFQTLSPTPTQSNQQWFTKNLLRPVYVGSGFNVSIYKVNSSYDECYIVSPFQLVFFGLPLILSLASNSIRYISLLHFPKVMITHCFV